MNVACHANGSQEKRPLTKVVLIIEDDDDIRDILTVLLQEETAYQVLHAEDGLVALALVETILPHLIVLDYRLPGMDGRACLDRLRTVPGLASTPTIFISASFPKQMKEELGMVYLRKPFGMDHFLWQVKHLLKE